MWAARKKKVAREQRDGELESEFRSGVDNYAYGESDVLYLWEPTTGKDLIWQALREEAAEDAANEPLLSGFLHGSVLSHSSFEQALAAVLAQRLASPTLLATHVRACPPPPSPSCTHLSKVNTRLSKVNTHLSKVNTRLSKVTLRQLVASQSTAGLAECLGTPSRAC